MVENVPVQLLVCADAILVGIGDDVWLVTISNTWSRCACAPYNTFLELSCCSEGYSMNKAQHNQVFLPFAGLKNLKPQLEIMGMTVVVINVLF